MRESEVQIGKSGLRGTMKTNLQRGSLIFAIMAFLLSVGVDRANADDITYNATSLLFTGLTGSGTITVDTSNLSIVAWDLAWTDGPCPANGCPSTLVTTSKTCSDATPCLTNSPGLDLSISGNDLEFNFSGLDGAILQLGGPPNGINGPYVDLVAEGVSLPSGYVVLEDQFFGIATLDTGNLVIGTAVPEPSTYGLTLMGLGCLGLMWNRLVQGMHQAT